MKQATTPDDVRDMADEVARLMAARFGGTKRGEYANLETMLRRRGAALPRKLRKSGQVLAQADRQTEMPRLARQVAYRPVNRAYAGLMKYLQPLGQVSRWKHRSVNFAASVLFGLLILAAVAIWLMVRRDLI